MSINTDTRSKVAQATAEDCNWERITPALIAETSKYARGLAGKLDLDADDLIQDTLLFMAVRPDHSPYWAVKKVADSMRNAATRDANNAEPLGEGIWA